MELWLDTIDLKAIREAEDMGFLSGVTTNPSILSQSDMAPENKIRQLLDYQCGWVAVQVLAQDSKNMIHEAKALSELSDRIIIKIPVTTNGLSAISRLTQEEIPTMATAIFEPRQLLLAAMAGARYAAPYMSRIQEHTKKSQEILGEMMKIIFQQSFHTKIIAAAIKSSKEILDYAKLGVPAVTLPVAVYTDFIRDYPHTESSLEAFEKDWLAGPHTSESKLFINSPPTEQ